MRNQCNNNNNKPVDSSARMLRWSTVFIYSQLQVCIGAFDFFTWYTSFIGNLISLDCNGLNSC